MGETWQSTLPLRLDRYFCKNGGSKVRHRSTRICRPVSIRPMEVVVGWQMPPSVITFSPPEGFPTSGPGLQDPQANGQDALWNDFGKRGAHAPNDGISWNPSRKCKSVSKHDRCVIGMQKDLIASLD